MIEISPQEEYIIKIMRDLRPYESIVINKDKQGKADTYLVQRSQKIMVSEIAIVEVR